jgi:hypothetical protein
VKSTLACVAAGLIALLDGFEPAAHASPCCGGGPHFLTFESGIAAGTCGTLQKFRCSQDPNAMCGTDTACDFRPCLPGPGVCLGNSSIACSTDAQCTGTCQEVTGGGFPRDLGCGSLYRGGGLSSLPLPVAIPDLGRAVTRVTSCDDTSGELTLGPATSTDTGSQRTCTEGRRCSNNGAPCVVDDDCRVGCDTGTCEDRCLFGPPVPLAYGTLPPFSTCLVNVVAKDAAGTAQCDDGEMNLSIGVASALYLTGDLLPDPGIQPCPLCTGPSGSETCKGGPQDGMPCTPGTSDLGDAFPTSADCPPDPALRVGPPISLDWALTTGQKTVDAVDLPSTKRAFCGFCRDASSGNFESPPRPCTADADCALPFPICAQRDPGAFGLAAASRITATGSADGLGLADGQPHDASLVSVSCIPPTFGGFLDAVLDLPGPDTTLLRGSVTLSEGVCGNGMVEGTEQCDGTADGECPGRCGADCTCGPSACCTGGQGFLSFETVVASGTCGSLRNLRCSGSNNAACSSDAECDLRPCNPVLDLCQDLATPCTADADCDVGPCAEVVGVGLPQDLTCGGLYIGGGGGGVPLPIPLPDGIRAIAKVTSCDAPTAELTVGPVTAAETGSNRTCTEGRKCSNDDSPCVTDADCGGGSCEDRCLLGPPLPVVNALVPGFSSCITNVLTDDVEGTADCDGDEVGLTLKVASTTHLTGDLLPDAGVQPCPLCTGPSGSETCKAGLNDGLPCTPGTSDQGDAFPTSADCPPLPGSQVGPEMSLVLGLTVASQVLAAVDFRLPAAQRVFCGFCRDGSSLAFENPPRPCTSPADCTPPFQVCAQRSAGAFGQGAATQIAVDGSSDGQSLADGQEHDVELVGLFCVPPTFDASIDGVGDLPGPGGAMLQGRLRLSASP